MQLSALQKVDARASIHRSRSVPELNKDGSTRPMDSRKNVFRVVPTIPKVPQDAGVATSGSSPWVDTGIYPFGFCKTLLLHAGSKSQITLSGKDLVKPNLIMDSSSSFFFFG